MDQLENDPVIINLGGMEKPAVSLGSGGYGTAYLYKKGAEYRVAKLYKIPDDYLGNVERRAESFNAIYSKIYGKKFSSLATAKVIRDHDTFLDMPYIGGVDYFYEVAYDKYPHKAKILLEYFKQYEFFVSDFGLRGNIVTFVDPKTKLEYILVRDVDLVGRRASYAKKGEKSVTHRILNGRAVSDGMTKDDLRSVLQIPETKSEPMDLPAAFEQVKTTLLKLMGPTHPKYAALQSTTDFPELCFIAAQKREAHLFSANEGSTGALTKLLPLINNQNMSALRAEFKLPQESDEYDLREVGFYGKLHNAQDKDAKLRKSNLQFIYSIKNNNKEFEAKLSELRSHSIFSEDFTKILGDEVPQVAEKETPSPVVTSTSV